MSMKNSLNLQQFESNGHEHTSAHALFITKQKPPQKTVINNYVMFS